MEKLKTIKISEAAKQCIDESYEINACHICNAYFGDDELNYSHNYLGDIPGMCNDCLKKEIKKMKGGEVNE